MRAAGVGAGAGVSAGAGGRAGPMCLSPNGTYQYHSDINGQFDSTHPNKEGTILPTFFTPVSFMY